MERVGLGGLWVGWEEGFPVKEIVFAALLVTTFEMIQGFSIPKKMS